VTCLLLTRNRPRWLPWSLRCAQYQTYQNKEILVVSSGQDVTDLIPPGVSHLHLSGKPSTGAARNAGCEAARGEVIAHFDDDDFSHPGRLEDQLRRLIDTGKPVTGYRSMRFTDGTRWWRYDGSADYALGTSLVYRRDFWQRNRFPDLLVGEDNAFVSRARACGGIATADAGGMMWATIHNANTSPRSVKGKQWVSL
jgi:O-antigen biosynthesis protein